MVRHRLFGCGVATLALIGARPVYSGPINFTGVVANDFLDTDRGVHKITLTDNPRDIGQADFITARNWVSGWSVQDVRFSYDQNTDTLFVGFNTFKNQNGQYAIIGDVDGDGDPGRAAPETLAAGGTDQPNLGGRESVALGIAPDGPNQGPGKLVAVAGISADKSASGPGLIGFNVAKPRSDTLGLGNNFGETLTDNLGELAFNPSAEHPGFEFTIKNFSKLEGVDPYRGFWVTAYAGAPDDFVVGETGLRLTRVPALAEQVIPEPATILAWSIVAGGSVLGLRGRRSRR
ncbi:MAG: hypothetical protein AB7I30_13385 [Isosphaeraceae bacterium]